MMAIFVSYSPTDPLSASLPAFTKAGILRRILALSSRGYCCRYLVTDLNIVLSCIRMSAEGVA